MRGKGKTQQNDSDDIAGGQGALFEGACISPVIPDWNQVPEDLGDIEIPVSGPVDLGTRWELMCDLAFEVSPAIACILEQARIRESDSRIKVLLGARFITAVGKESLSAFVSSLDRTVFEHGPTFEVCEDTEETGEPEEVDARRQARVFTNKQSEMRAKMLNHPVVARAIELFNPEKVDVAVWINPDAIRD